MKERIYYRYLKSNSKHLGLKCCDRNATLRMKRDSLGREMWWISVCGDKQRVTKAYAKRVISNGLYIKDYEELI